MSKVSVFKSQEANERIACGEKIKATDFMHVFRLFWRFLHKKQERLRGGE